MSQLHSPIVVVPQEMRLVFPNSHRINRGNYVVKELAEACRANDITDLVILHEHRGKPGVFSIPHSSLFSCKFVLMLEQMQ